MTALNLKAEIDTNIGIIANDEGLMKRLARYVKKLAAEKQADDSCMTKEEFMAKLERAEKQIEKGEYTTLMPGETVVDMLKRCGYDI